MELVQSGDRGQRLEATTGERVVHLQTPKISPRPNGRAPEAVVIHYTAVRSPSRPKQHLNQFRGVLGPEFAAVEAFVEAQGSIPSALMLSLGNASRPERKASWDVTVGKDGLVVQCNLQPSTAATWHAGRDLADYRARHRDRDLRDRRGRLVYDGRTKQFVAPVLPKSGAVMQSGNTFSVGIELENWGRVHKINGVYCRRDGTKSIPIPDLHDHDVIQVEGRSYDRITEAQSTALIAVCRAYRNFYRLPSDAWFGHHHIVPDRRSDPEPPVDLDRLIEDIYADRLQHVAVRSDSDLEEEFVASPLPHNDAVDLG